MEVSPQIQNHYQDMLMNQLWAAEPMAHQDFGPELRDRILGILFRLQQRFRPGSESFDVFFLAVNYFDRFLARVRLSRPQFNLVMISSIILADKFEQEFSLEIEDLESFLPEGDFEDPTRALVAMEWTILETLKYRLYVTTAWTFLQFFLSLVPNRTRHFDRAVDHFTLLTIDETMLEYSPNLRTLAAIKAATLQKTSEDDPDYSPISYLEPLTGIHHDDEVLRAATEQLLEVDRSGRHPHIRILP